MGVSLITTSLSSEFSTATLSGGDLTAALGSGNKAVGYDGKTTGKYYFEVTCNSVIDTLKIGLSSYGWHSSGTNANTRTYQSTGVTGYLAAGGSGPTLSTFTTADVIGIAVDFDTGAVWFSKNGSWENGATLSEIQTGDTTNAVFTDADSEYPSSSYVYHGPWFPWAYSTNGSNITFDFTPSSPPTGYGTWTRADPTSSTNVWDDDLHTSTNDIGSYDGGVSLASKNDRRGARGTISKSSGKWYFEYESPIALDNNTILGLGTSSVNLNSTVDALAGLYAIELVNSTNYTFQDNGSVTGNKTRSAAASTDTYMVAVDLDSSPKKIWFGLNGTWLDSGDPVAGTNPSATGVSTPLYPMTALRGSFGECWLEANFGQKDFSEDPPSGYTAGWGDIVTSDATVELTSLSVAAEAHFPNHYIDGAIDAVVTVDGTANIPNKYADGDITLSITPSASMHIADLHADGAVNVPTLLASGTMTNPAVHISGGVTVNTDIESSASIAALHADGDITTGAITLAGGATVYNRHLAGGVTMSLTPAGVASRHLYIDSSTVTPSLSITATGEVDALAHVTSSLLPLTFEGEMAGSGVIDSEIVFSELTVDFDVISGSVLYGEAVIPEITLESYGSDNNSIYLQPLSIESSVLSGVIIKSESDFQALTISADAEADGIYNLTANLPRVRLDTNALTGNVIDAPLVLLEPTTDFTALAGGMINLSASFEEIDVNAVALISGIASATLGFEPLRTVIDVSAAVSVVYNTWVMNSENYAVSSYVNTDHIAWGVFKGKTYGVTAAGIFEHTGSTDTGTEIAASFRTGIDTFKTENLKRMPNAYVGYESDGDMTLYVSTDGGVKNRTFPLERISHTTGVKRSRVTLAKGLKSRYWQVGMDNVDGADFTVGELGLLVRTLSRKT